MKYVLATRAAAQYDALPARLKAKFLKQLGFLLSNPRHPSLQAKKYDDTENRWQARIDQNWRFYFRIEGDTYYILTIIPHPK
ncbi:MAG: hypothetical protein HY207_00015 [Nitrospirae bacterium]|nr:hypothetical protein [Nitrospirota bacterium]